MKEYTAVEYREHNGEELPDELIPKYKARISLLKWPLWQTLELHGMNDITMY